MNKLTLMTIINVLKTVRSQLTVMLTVPEKQYMYLEVNKSKALLNGSIYFLKERERGGEIYNAPIRYLVLYLSHP